MSFELFPVNKSQIDNVTTVGQTYAKEIYPCD